MQFVWVNLCKGLWKKCPSQNVGNIEPIDYILDTKNEHTFQYVQIAKSLHQLLGKWKYLIKFLKVIKEKETYSGGSHQYWSSRAVPYLRKRFPFCITFNIILNPYVDDFEAWHLKLKTKSLYCLLGIGYSIIYSLFGFVKSDAVKILSDRFKI